MMRRIGLGIALLLIWLGVLGWSSGVSWRDPIFPRARFALNGQDLKVQFGTGAVAGTDLAVSALAADGTGLQTATLQRLRADDFPVLRYRVSDFPNTLELALVFRRSDMPDDVQTISLPAPGRGDTSVNLATFADWHGQITELGFAQYAAAQLVPPSAALFRPFRIEHIQLQSPSWSEVFSRLRSDWFGYRPWALYSISALGPQILTLNPSWMQPAIVIGLLLSIAAAWALLRWSRRRMVLAAFSAALGAWILLDLRWLDDLFAKHRIIETLYAGKSWPQRVALQPDEDTYAAAADITKLAAAQGVKRILVLADAPYTMLRLIYFLLPLNAAPMLPILASAPGGALPRDALIVAFNSEWTYDAASGNLSDGKQRIAVTQVFARDDLRAYRPREVAP